MTEVAETTIIPYDQRNPDRVQFFDNTLREGDQSPGVAFSVIDKVEIARRLEKAGIDIIEAGFPVSSQGDFEGVQAVSRETRFASVAALARANIRDIETAWEAIEDTAFPRIHTFIATSDSHMKAMGMSPNQVEKAATEAVARAAEFTPWVEFSAEDASRSDFKTMMRVFHAVTEVGATIINIPDTPGFITPEKWTRIIERVRAEIDDSIIISTHMHNDLGLAVANTVAAVLAGARQVEVATNGAGERAGNASFEQTVAILRLHPDQYGEGLADHINTRSIGPLSAAVRAAMGYPVIPNQPIVGPNVFSHEAGIHADKVRIDRSTYEIMRPEEWGWQGEQIAFGAHSGVNSFRGVAQEYGFEIPANFREIVQTIKDHCRDVGHGISEAEIVDIFAISPEIRFSKGYVVRDYRSEQDDTTTTVQFELYEPGFETPLRAFAEVASRENGTIAAIVKAFNQATDRKIDIVGFEESIVEGESGADSRAKTTITVKNGSEKDFKGKAISANTDKAHLQAFINAVNVMDREE